MDDVIRRSGSKSSGYVMQKKSNDLTPVLESLARLESKVDAVSETMATLTNDHRELREKYERTSDEVIKLTVRLDQAEATIRGWRGWVARVAAGVGVVMLIATATAVSAVLSK